MREDYKSIQRGQAKPMVHCTLGKKLGQFCGLVGMLLLCLPVTAQQQTVSGTVKEVDGTPLPGVTVQVKGTTTGTQTGIDGTYQVSAPVSATLVFSYIGKTSQEIAVASGQPRTAIDVTLADDSKPLQEVVVVGYGSQRRQDVPGAITSISTADFQKSNIVNPEQLIQGKLAGISITPPSGQPGGTS